MEKKSAPRDLEMDVEMDAPVNDICLVQTRRHKIPLKDFNEEIRSILDVDHFLCNATVVLNITVSFI